MTRRVLVTGMDLMTSLGLDLESSWSGLVEGKSGVRRISLFDPARYETQIAAELPAGFESLVREHANRRLMKQMARATQMAYVSAKRAVAAAGIDFAACDRSRCGVIFGAADTGHSSLCDNEYWILKTMPHSAPAWIAMEFGLSGPGYTVSAACASAACAIGVGYDLIAMNRADVVLVGGSSSIVNPEHVCGFNELRALSTTNDDPARASRPFSRGRNGFVMGEGAAVLVLEAEDAARRRGASVIGELAGHAVTNEAHNIMAPRPEGAGMAQTMRLALKQTGVPTDEVGYISAHGTSTPLNDKLETLAIKDVFGPHAYSVPVSSAKSMIGHTAGACGAVEGVITLLSLARGVLTPTINYQRDPELDLDYVPHEARPASVSVALSNSFGFGGCNATLVFRKCA